MSTKRQQLFFGMDAVMRMVAQNITALMQLVAVSLPSYNMNLITTKCLNTAMTLVLLFLGDKSVNDASKCDVHNVVSRVRSDRKDNSLGLLRDLHDRIFDETLVNTVCGTTCDCCIRMFYIMITDGHVQKVLPSGRDNKFFPGHVFLIEQRTSSSSDAQEYRQEYRLYQSYINQYDLSGEYAMRELTADQVKHVLSNLESLFSSPALLEKAVWSSKTTQFWKELTGVNASEFEGYTFEGHIFFCYTEVTTPGLVERLREFLRKRLNDIEREVLLKPAALDELYGEQTCVEVANMRLSRARDPEGRNLQDRAKLNTNSSRAVNTNLKTRKPCVAPSTESAQPLSNKQMREAIRKMLADLPATA